MPHLDAADQKFLLFMFLLFGGGMLILAVFFGLMKLFGIDLDGRGDDEDDDGYAPPHRGRRAPPPDDYEDEDEDEEPARRR